MTEHVLVSLGPDESSFEALDFACRAYRGNDQAQIEVVHVDSGSRGMRLIEEAENLIEDSPYEGDYTTEIVEEGSLVGGNSAAGSVVSRLAEDREVDHIVMGRPDRSLFGHLLKGSATNEVLENTPAPVTLVGTEADDPVHRLDG